jgi:hypothetical protein
MSFPKKEYAFRIVAADAVQEYLNNQGLQGYVLMTQQPFVKKIKDTSEGTMEEVVTYSITMERSRREEALPSSAPAQQSQ